MTVTGAGARWDLTDYLQVGDARTGQLTVSGGGVVTTTAARCTIARGSGTTSQANVTGAGSLLDIDGDLTVGQDGHGILSIANGGKVVSPASRIGHNSGSNGMVTVTGAGSWWEVTNWVGVATDGGTVTGPDPRSTWPAT